MAWLGLCMWGIWLHKQRRWQWARDDVGWKWEVVNQIFSEKAKQSECHQFRCVCNVAAAATSCIKKKTLNGAPAWCGTAGTRGQTKHLTCCSGRVGLFTKRRQHFRTKRTILAKQWILSCSNHTCASAFVILLLHHFKLLMSFWLFNLYLNPLPQFFF